ncbi:MAG: thioredoxin fold domain-containing protein [Desulfobacula sp.]|jgi:thioredoxin-related protein|uniref:thioredoxin family protein n=1 Tax=Desulfobacula sp. TaxID=2593537 RepID=UPI001DAF3FDA|nr:thioredoxin fold domain-containing protein [Desulfobacula sp.]MBT3484752.1 thioredoxin fold domain-containing protein [Desulfobacula sp.]MBT3804382.1 thioredoxin fold domain-containing protein [Desulfobacula sp.]MBT4025173.1 thioredoxin fold domain-containing protein [Desulfobacula sp.]MBT4198575.1 thioredoxin fold domain-containing protein [Desulfobacula sp.]
MKKENLLVIAIICIAVIGFVAYKNFNSKKQTDSIQGKGFVQTSDSSKIDWQNYAQGRELAKNQNKHIFLYFHADWCTYCRKLKKTTFKDKTVLKYLKDNFISIEVDTDKNQEMAAQWNVKGLPTMWFLKSDRSKISSIPGYVDKKQFLHILKYIHTQSYEKMNFQQFMKTI